MCRTTMSNELLGIYRRKVAYGETSADAWRYVEILEKNRNIPKKDTQILITPWATNYNKQGPCSKRDWEEQMERGKNGHQMMWDDSKYNKSKCGDLFIIFRHKIGVLVHRITDIKPPKDRLETWSRNVGQTDKLYLFLKK